MKVIKGLTIATCMALGLGWIFAFFSDEGLGFTQNMISRAEQPVFINQQPIILSKKTLVSFMKSIPMEFSYKQMEIEGNSLFIKAHVSLDGSSSHQFMQQQTIFKDAYTLLDSVYHASTNIEHVYIRFIHFSESQNRLLLSVESERTSFLANPLDTDQQLDIAHGPYEEQILQSTRTIFGTGWEFDDLK
ncbi:hypothetical protein [Bacillus horti]|uniref:Uncharacterized protein n=1 Tax=Caldalkalibacillus horti TaxID=77523 RepID=A0ABT9VWV3_9BACI|nr:hypothetical protein [Bacillus horti]MDQ0165462.1 hypothetical protein [Bacillus horti]